MNAKLLLESMYFGVTGRTLANDIKVGMEAIKMSDSELEEAINNDPENINIYIAEISRREMEETDERKSTES